MAISLESSGKVFRKAEKFVANANPEVRNALAALKNWLVQQKGNPDLQFIPFTAAQVVTNGGYSPDVDAARVYFAYFKGARTTGTTAAFGAIHDATDNSATTTTIVSAKFNLLGQEFHAAYPNGFALATELTVSCATAVGGATESSAADAFDGFVIVGA